MSDTTQHVYRADRSYNLQPEQRSDHTESSPEGGSPKRPRDEDDIASYLPNKRGRPKCVRVNHSIITSIKTLATFHRFQQDKHMAMEMAQFTSLCGYLHLLVRWKCPISPHAYDAFILYYHSFLRQAKTKQLGQAAQTDTDFVYWQWLSSQQLPSTGDQILDIDTLNDISKESPYTFNIVEESIRIIISQGGAV